MNLFSPFVNLSAPRNGTSMDLFLNLTLKKPDGEKVCEQNCRNIERGKTGNIAYGGKGKVKGQEQSKT